MSSGYDLDRCIRAEEYVKVCAQRKRKVTGAVLNDAIEALLDDLEDQQLCSSTWKRIEKLRAVWGIE